MGFGARVLIEKLRMRQENDKSLGQHFLNNEEVLDQTIELSGLTSDDVVIEVGPGPGVLTERLLESGCDVRAIEIDPGVCKFLREIFPNLSLTEDDALLAKWPSANKFIANIPYQISSPLIHKITQNPSIQQLSLIHI